MTCRTAKFHLLLFVLVLTYGISAFGANQQQEKVPSIIPIPKTLTWMPGNLDLKSLGSILVTSPALSIEAKKYQAFLKEQGVDLPIKDKADKRPALELKLADMLVPHLAEEAYTIDIDQNRILITAATAHGIYNAFQTFQQLTTGTSVKSCKITDWPSFEVRGYMVDVGRKYQSLPQLFEQIDAMARYKLNVFQFHATEDVAWRLESKKYPQLNKPEHMTRQKGKFYSVADIKALILYCQERHIEFLPEIDMPGHSAAFRRAMGMDMQSTEGLATVKELIKEFSDTYNLPYLHIGGDEVKITNHSFLPEAIRFAESLGKKTLGWKPGGNIAPNTIRQLWMGGEKADKNFQYIDSRHLYINHMDPFESVATLFERRIGDRTESDKNMLGGILCLWHDRQINREQDLLEMNPVYPSIIAFAERSWAGGGYETWISNIDPAKKDRIVAFRDFENRMLDHKARHFSGKAFPYSRQGDIEWKLFGPYENKGYLIQEFLPETQDFDPAKSPSSITALGATVVLRHFWAPMVKGVLPQPAENTTWYAYRQFWSESDTTINFWVGFNNLSRSYATNTPKASTWDDRGSKLWINGSLVQPPPWKNAGQTANLETPLTDEGYEYRSPLQVRVRKGWNDIKMKLPVASFKGTDWNNPVKWMFTAVPLL